MHRDVFLFNEGGYATLNFVPSLATMIFGLLVGGLLRGGRSDKEKLLWLVGAGVVGLAVGLALDALGVCPIVKRIWTPSWTLFSTGWTCLFLAGFYGLIDLLRWQAWSFPLRVVGMNSIAMYCMFQLMRKWLFHAIEIHFWWFPNLLGRWFGSENLAYFGQLYGPMVRDGVTLLGLWLICLWLYRQKIFIRL